MGSLKIYFSDYFNVDAEIVEEYGAINISLINDMPLFIDPFLLFNSENPEYQEIHNRRGIFFTDQEYEKLMKVLNDLKLHNCPDIVLIDARNNKPSASNVA